MNTNKKRDFKTTPAPSAPKAKDNYAAANPKPSKAVSEAKDSMIYLQLALGLAALSGLLFVFYVLLRQHPR